MTISPDLDRRTFLVAGATAFGALALGPRALRADDFALSETAKKALAESPLVYVSPLRSDGGESRCHGEVWYFHDGGDVVLATGKDTWKARALGRGLDRARLWVGDFGVAKSADGPFREGPTFLARASRDPERATFDRLLQAFGRKYPDEWGKWKPRFESGYADGSRVVIRYAPIGA